MVLKIISGGQTGVDRAALDAAIELRIPHSGWVPKGRKAEDGAIPEKYKLDEMPTNGYAERTEQNIADSDGTLIISRGRLTDGSLLTLQLAAKRKRPCLHMDLSVMSTSVASKTINSWISRHGIAILNVAGPRASKDPGIYRMTVDILKNAFQSHPIGPLSPTRLDTNMALPYSRRLSENRLLLRSAANSDGCVVKPKTSST